jgi:hypothetical protein
LWKKCELPACFGQAKRVDIDLGRSIHRVAMALLV